MAQTVSKNPLKDKLCDDELDLSISNYKDKDVPVKDIALLKRATKLDLSNNKLTGLPKTFASLTHLVKLDLSSNIITELPSNFGELHRLRHLDLYNNKLSHLPLSFHQLSSLRWLDLKNNELSPQLAEAAGECLNPRECEQCARRVVSFMARVKEHYDEERQRRQQHEKELMNAKLAAEEAEKERVRAEKKAKKEQKKQELRERRRLESLSAHSEEQEPLKTVAPVPTKLETARKVNRARWSFLARVNLLLLLTTLAMFCATVYLHAHGDVSRSGLRSAVESLKANLATLSTLGRHQARSALDAGLVVVGYVSELGTGAGDVLVGRVMSLYEWGSTHTSALDKYLSESNGPAWHSVKTTSTKVLTSLGEFGKLTGERALVVTSLMLRKGWELGMAGGAAAWDAAGPLGDAIAEAGTAVKAGVLVGAAKLRQDALPVLLQWAVVAKDAAVDLVWTVQQNAPGYAASMWAATCRGAAYTYDLVSSLWTSASTEAPSYASMAADQFNRLLATVTGG